MQEKFLTKKEIKETDKLIKKHTKKLFASRYIAKYKIYCPLESFLGFLADRFEIGKTLYVLFYKIFDYKYYKKGLAFIKKEITRFKGEVKAKEYKKLQKDMVYSLHRFGCPFEEYFLFGFKRLNAFARKQYITDKERYVFTKLFNSRKNYDLFKNKIETYNKFKKYYKREILLVDSNTSQGILIEFLKKHPVVFKKIPNEGLGVGAEKLSVKDYNNDYIKLSQAIYQKAPCLLEELLENIPAIKEIAPNALSTLRITTINTSEKVFFDASLLKFSLDNSIIDNGLNALIDIKTGCIKKVVDANNISCCYHPQTHKKIIGFEIPQWQEILAFTKELALVVPENRYTAFDIALTTKGIVMIEGNFSGEVHMAQAVEGHKFSKKKLFYSLLQK